MTETAVQPQEQQSTICLHEELMIVSPSDFTHKIMCVQCLKKLVIDSLYLEPPCIVAQVEEAFGPAWGAKVALVCPCSEHRKRGEP